MVLQITGYTLRIQRELKMGGLVMKEDEELKELSSKMDEVMQLLNEVLEVVNRRGLEKSPSGLLVYTYHALAVLCIHKKYNLLYSISNMINLALENEDLLDEEEDYYED
jgi:hypothetical protein